MINHPNRSRSYANCNKYGSETSYGFDNTNQVYVFATRSDRDAWVAEHSPRNKSIYPLTASAARKLAERSPDHPDKRIGYTVDGGYAEF